MASEGVEAVLAGEARWHAEACEAREWLAALPPKGVDLVFGSPPYPEKLQRYKDIPTPGWMPCGEWIDFMLGATERAVRACRGDVLWVVNNPVKDGRYVPAVEGLVWKWYETGRRLDRPVIWHKNSAPSRRDWFGNDWEFVLCFPGGDRRTWNWQSIGTPPKYKAGGRFRQRGQRGERRAGGDYPQNPVTRPRDVLRCTVGGGHLGHPLAHENEAPFPVKLAEPFVLALTDPGGVVADPFAGSGSTGHAALLHGRRFVGADLRPSQVDLTRKRLSSLEPS